MAGGRPSRTAVFVCQGRAVGDGRLAVGRFADPVAARLLRSEERELVELARGDGVPQDWRRRLAVESVRACAEVVVPRTVAIDEAVAAAGHDQVVIVGAGLDTRPWRLESLRDAAVFLVDQPASQADAELRAAGLVSVARHLERIPADLSVDALDAVLAGRLDRTRPTTWIWEGVVPYLTRAQVRATVAAIAASSPPGSVVIVNYQAATLAAAIGGRLVRLLREPWRSLWRPDELRRLFEANGFVVESDRDLLDVAASIGSPSRRRSSLRSGRLAVAARA